MLIYYDILFIFGQMQLTQIQGPCCKMPTSSGACESESHTDEEVQVVTNGTSGSRLKAKQREKGSQKCVLN